MHGVAICGYMLDLISLDKFTEAIYTVIHLTLASVASFFAYYLYYTIGSPPTVKHTRLPVSTGGDSLIDVGWAHHLVTHFHNKLLDEMHGMSTCIDTCRQNGIR